MLKTQTHSVWTGDLGMPGKGKVGLASRALSSTLPRSAPMALGDSNSRIGNSESKGRVLNGTRSRIFCSGSVFTPGKTEDLISNASRYSHHPGGLSVPGCLKMICGCLKIICG